MARLRRQAAYASRSKPSGAFLRLWDLPCDTADAIADSRIGLNRARLPPLITATSAHPFDLPICRRMSRLCAHRYEKTARSLQARFEAAPHGRGCYGLDKPGYHVLEIGDDRVTFAVAPPRCFTIADMQPDERLWGLAVQTYGLRRPGDCGIGDMAGVAGSCQEAASIQGRRAGAQPHARVVCCRPNRITVLIRRRAGFSTIRCYADPTPLFGDAGCERP